MTDPRRLDPPQLQERSLPLRDVNLDPSMYQTPSANAASRPLNAHPPHLRSQPTETSEASSNASTPTRESEAEFHVVEPNDWRSSHGLPPFEDLSMQDKADQDAPVNKLPPELLIAVFTKLTTPSDLLSCMQVSKTWAGHSVALLWHRPMCNDTTSLFSVARTLSADQTYFQYGSLVKRLNLSALHMAKDINDGTLSAMASCKKIERLTLTGCLKLTDSSIMPLLEGNENLLALDVSNVVEITDASLIKAAKHCKKLQGLNVTGDSNISDISILEIAQSCALLKRLKLNDCMKITDTSVLKLAQHCRHILEIDLYRCTNIKDISVTTLLRKGKHLRELRLAFCKAITDDAFLSLRDERQFETLRILDLTACENLTDSAVRQITEMAPRLRNLVLAKCTKITDSAVMAISRLGKNLHYVHLGHCNQISDPSIKHLIKMCNRIRYIDLACCDKLTDDSIELLAMLPKLRRIGLVKCSQVTDRSILALARPRTLNRLTGGTSSLERVHLSYCENLSIRGIHSLLMACQRLTHLSLTGVTDFLRDDLTKFCRQPPPEFTQRQRDMFCVFSGAGVGHLREYLDGDLLHGPTVQPNNPDAQAQGHWGPDLSQHLLQTQPQPPHLFPHQHAHTVPNGGNLIQYVVAHGIGQHGAQQNQPHTNGAGPTHAALHGPAANGMNVNAHVIIADEGEQIDDIGEDSDLG